MWLTLHNVVVDLKMPDVLSALIDRAIFEYQGDPFFMDVSEAMAAICMRSCPARYQHFILARLSTLD
jgi:hypothetical protein